MEYTGYGTSYQQLKKDYRDVMAPTPERVFMKRIDEMERRANKEYQPFCRACAWNKMRDAIEDKRRDIERRMGACAEDHRDFLKVAQELDLEEFYGEKVHNRTAENPQTETKLSSMGRRETNVVGYYIEYECKRLPNMHKCSIFVAVEDYEKMKVADKKKPNIPEKLEK